MRNFLQLAKEEGLRLLIGTGLMVGVSWFLGFLQGIPWYIYPLIPVFVFPMVLLALNELRRLRRDRVFVGESNKQIETTIRNWLDQRAYSTRPDPKDEMLFQFIAVDLQGKKYAIARPKSNDSFIVAGCGLKISDEEIPLIDGLSKSIRENMIEDLRLEFARLGVEYQGVQHPLRAVGIEMYMACDETLTQISFLRGITTIRSAAIITAEIIRRAVRVAKESAEHSS